MAIRKIDKSRMVTESMDKYADRMREAADEFSAIFGPDRGSAVAIAAARKNMIEIAGDERLGSVMLIILVSVIKAARSGDIEGLTNMCGMRDWTAEEIYELCAVTTVNLAMLAGFVAVNSEKTVSELLDFLETQVGGNGEE